MANRPRNPGESFYDYRLSLAIEYLSYKASRRGRLIHVSRPLIPHPITGQLVAAARGTTYWRGNSK